MSKQTKAIFFLPREQEKATAVPDTSLINLGVTKTASTVSQAQQQQNQAVNKILNDLNKLGIEEKNIKTVSYSIYPNYDYSSGKQTPTGYTATQNLEVKIKPIEKANIVIDGATANGANLVSGITFTLDDKIKKELEQKARTEAVNDAKEKAQQLANAGGVRLGRIIDIQESQTPVFGPPMPMGAGTLQKEDQRQQSSISAGENTVEINVILSWEVL